MILKIAGPIKQASLARNIAALGTTGAAAGIMSTPKTEDRKKTRENRIKAGLIWGSMGALGPILAHKPQLIKKLAENHRLWPQGPKGENNQC